MRDTMILQAQKKQEEEKKQQLKQEQEELKDILLLNIQNEYIKNDDFSHYNENTKIILIEKSIKQLKNMYKLIKSDDYYYYYILNKYETIGNKAKKYALNSPEYIKRKQIQQKAFELAWDNFSNKLEMEYKYKKSRFVLVDYRVLI